MTTQSKSTHRGAGEGTIYKDTARNRWVAQVTVGYDGRTGRLIRRSKSARTRKEAQAALAALKEKYASQTAILASRMTVGLWLDRWFDTYSRPHIRQNTAAGYLLMIDIAKEYVGRIDLEALCSFDLQNVINKRLYNHYREAQYFCTVMKMAFARAVKLKIIPENPAEDLELPKKPPKRPFIAPTKEQREALIEAPSIYYCWRQMMLVEFMTGLRRGELLALHWEDLNLEEGWLKVRHALVNGRKEAGMDAYPVFLSEPKTEKSRRQLYLPPALCRELAAYKVQQMKLRLQNGHWEHPEMVFTDKDGAYISPCVFSSQYVKVRKKLGIKTTFHMLRHDMASRMKASHRFDFKDIQEQLGHSTIQITMDIYTHINEEKKAAVSDWLQNDMDNVVDFGECDKTQLRQMK